MLDFGELFTRYSITQRVTAYGLSGLLGQGIVVFGISAYLLGDSAESSAVLQALAIALVFTVGGFALLTFITLRQMMRPLDVLRRTLERLGAGDHKLRVPLTERGDEIGVMARAIATLREGMQRADSLQAEQNDAKEAEVARAHRIERSVNDFTARAADVLRLLTEEAKSLKDKADTMLANSRATSSQALHAADSSSQAAANVQTIETATGSLAQSFDEISRQVADSTRTATNAAATARKTDQTVQGLNDAAQRIGAVVQLIQDIAGQTNLLALNATIEAARAGEAGKGFAVVAGEVKSLANQTARATEEIVNQVSQIQAVSAEATEAIRAITDTVGRIEQSSSAIAAAVEQQAATTTDISENVTAAAARSLAVSGAVAVVGHAAKETSELAGDVLTASQRLADLADQMRRTSDDFVRLVKAAG